MRSQNNKEEGDMGTEGGGLKTNPHGIQINFI